MERDKFLWKWKNIRENIVFRYREEEEEDEKKKGLSRRGMPRSQGLEHAEDEDAGDMGDDDDDGQPQVSKEEMEKRAMWDTPEIAETRDRREKAQRKREKEGAKMWAKMQALRKDKEERNEEKDAAS